MFIQVQALGIDGRNGAWRAQRFWPAGGPVRVEVLDQDEDPEKLEQEYEKDGAKEKRLIPDPLRIGRKSYEALRADLRIKTWNDAETNEAQSAAELEETRAALKRKAGDLVEAEAKIAALTKQVKAATRRADEFEAKVDELQELLTAATAPAAPAAPAADADKKPDVEGKRK